MFLRALLLNTVDDPRLNAASNVKAAAATVLSVWSIEGKLRPNVITQAPIIAVTAYVKNFSGSFF